MKYGFWNTDCTQQVNRWSSIMRTCWVRVPGGKDSSIRRNERTSIMRWEHTNTCTVHLTCIAAPHLVLWTLPRWQRTRPTTQWHALQASTIDNVYVRIHYLCQCLSISRRCAYAKAGHADAFMSAWRHISVSEELWLRLRHEELWGMGTQAPRPGVPLSEYLFLFHYESDLASALLISMHEVPRVVSQ